MQVVCATSTLKVHARRLLAAFCSGLKVIITLDESLRTDPSKSSSPMPIWILAKGRITPCALNSQADIKSDESETRITIKLPNKERNQPIRGGDEPGTVGPISA